MSYRGRDSFLLEIFQLDGNTVPAISRRPLTYVKPRSSKRRRRITAGRAGKQMSPEMCLGVLFVGVYAA